MAWLKTTGELTVPKSHLANAINYCLNQWDALNTFLLDGRIPIDNNAAERAIRPFVIGRKNFLFCNSPNGGAKASAITYSLAETAKENGLKPYDYLEYLLDELPNADLTDLDRFMPWSKALPEHCRTSKKKIALESISSLHLTDGGFFSISSANSLKRLFLRLDTDYFFKAQTGVLGQGVLVLSLTFILHFISQAS